MNSIPHKLAAGAAALLIACVSPLVAQPEPSAQTPETASATSETQRFSLPPSLVGFQGLFHLPRRMTIGDIHMLPPEPLSPAVDPAEMLRAAPAQSGNSVRASSAPRSAGARSARPVRANPSSLAEIGVPRNLAAIPATSTASSPPTTGAGGELDGPTDPRLSAPPVIRGTRGEISRSAYSYTTTLADPSSRHGAPASRGATRGQPTTYGTAGDPTQPDPGAGWTELVKSPDTRVIYVSSSQGSDSNSGLTKDRPVRTIAKGKSLVRMGYPDWLLLKRGDAWVETFGGWQPYGRSEAERMVVGAYGEGPRPLIKCGGNDGWKALKNEIAHLIITDLDFLAHTRDPSHSSFDPSMTNAGFSIVGGATDVTIEGCRFRLFGTGLVIQSFDGNYPEDMRIRRNVVADSYSTNSHSQGIFALGTRRMLLEENVFDRNGWHPSIPEAEPTMFNHNAYLHASAGNSMIDLVVRGNVFANASSFGLKVVTSASGGQQNPMVERNVLVGNGNGFTHGSGEDYGILGSTVRQNVFLDIGRNINGTPQAYGIDVGSCRDVTVTGNLFAHKEFAGTTFCVNLDVGGPHENVTVAQNIAYGWNGAVIRVSSSDVTKVAVSENTIIDWHEKHEIQILAPGAQAGVSYRDNRYRSTMPEPEWFRADGREMSLSEWVSYTHALGETKLAEVRFKEPSRDLALYDRATGGSGSKEQFLARLRISERSNWNDDLTGTEISAYMLEGFAETP